jgi:argininosuccinate synthase
MTNAVVLAYDGEFDAAAAIAGLRGRHQADVVTMTVDIGQSRDVQETRERALGAGAVRAHVFDDIDAFARHCVVPALASGAEPVAAMVCGTSLAYPILAARLVETARIEGAATVAHGGGSTLTAAIRAIAPALTVVTIETASSAPPAPSRGAHRTARHLLQRPSAPPATAGGTAVVEIEIVAGVPVSINSVPLSAAELLESLALIGGEHGIGHGDAVTAPGALILEAAYRAAGGASGVVRIELRDGQQQVQTAAVHNPELVHHA